MLSQLEVRELQTAPAQSSIQLNSQASLLSLPTMTATNTQNYRIRTQGIDLQPNQHTVRQVTSTTANQEHGRSKTLHETENRNPNPSLEISRPSSLSLSMISEASHTRIAYSCTTTRATAGAFAAFLHAHSYEPYFSHTLMYMYRIAPQPMVSVAACVSKTPGSGITAVPDTWPRIHSAARL